MRTGEAKREETQKGWQKKLRIREGGDWGEAATGVEGEGREQEEEEEDQIYKNTKGDRERREESRRRWVNERLFVSISHLEDGFQLWL